MSCGNGLGFQNDGTLVVAKTADTEETLTFPTTNSRSFNFIGFGSEFRVRKTPGGVISLTINTTGTVNGSMITMADGYVILTIKKEDLTVFPSFDDPFEAQYEWSVTDPSGLTTRLIAGDFLVYIGV